MKDYLVLQKVKIKSVASSYKKKRNLCLKCTLVEMKVQLIV